MSTIFFVNRYFYPDHSATSQMLSDLVFELAAMGYSIEVITSRQLYDNPAASLKPVEVLEGVRVHRAWTSRFGRAGLAGRAVDYVNFYLSAFWRLVRRLGRRDIVVAKTDPPMISVVCAVAALFRGAALINWIQDLFPEVAVALNVRGAGFVSPLLRRLRNWSLLRADRNVVLGDLMAKRLSDQGIARHTIHLIPNWADGELIHPVPSEHNDLRTEWNLKDKFVVGYSGNLGRAHEFSTILRAAEMLRDRSDRVVFLFIGGGQQRAVVERCVCARNLPNVLFRPYQPKEKLAQSLSVPDVHLISLQPKLEGLIVPSKFYGICAAGRATLYVGDPQGEIPQIIRAMSCGDTIEPGDAAGLATVIEKWSKNPETVHAMGARARARFERSFDKRYAIQTWSEMVDGLISGEIGHETARPNDIPF
jgi:colanic acid biosynthesis glycosyl transferase WcaI